MMTILSKYVPDNLITHEDPFHIHKHVGLYCLVNFFVQFCLYTFTGTPHLSFLIILPHMLLHASSFFFKVLEKRQITQDGKIVAKTSMFIWKELRLHSLIFGFRSCLCILSPQYAREVVFLTLISADIVTSRYGIPNVTTVRGNHDISKSSLKKLVYGMFFSTSQLGATIICAGLFQKVPSPILTFATLPAIQTSAFGMTLMRKNIITKETWQIVYSAELLLVYVLWYCEYKNIHILLYSLVAYLMRVVGVNKYALWMLFFLADAVFQNKETLFSVLLDVVFV